MNTIRVNLLRPAEKRYTGSVSRPFIIRAAAAGGGALILLLLLLLVVQVRVRRQNLVYLQQRFEHLEPDYNAVRNMQRDLEVNRGLRRELDGWHDSRIDWRRMLLELQAIVPDNVQFTRMEVRGNLFMLEDAARHDEDGREPASLPARRFTADLAGLAVGAGADETALSFLQQMRDSEYLKSVCESINLRQLRRDIASGDRGPVSMFQVEIVGRSRVMP